MIALAQGKFLRISPKKTNIVVRLLRGKTVAEGLAILYHTNKRAKEYLIKILQSAVSNAKMKGFQADQLYISKVVVAGGPSWKRFRAASFGRANEIKKRTSHIRLELDVVSPEALTSIAQTTRSKPEAHTHAPAVEPAHPKKIQRSAAATKKPMKAKTVRHGTKS